MWVDELGRELTGRHLEIWEGRSGLPPEAEEAYRRRWRGKAAAGPRRAGSGPAAGPVAPCLHLGRRPAAAERTALRLAPGRDWHRCEKGRGAGGFVCPCMPLCGRGCPDYEADG